MLCTKLYTKLYTKLCTKLYTKLCTQLYTKLYTKLYVQMFCTKLCTKLYTRLYTKLCIGSPLYSRYSFHQIRCAYLISLQSPPTTYSEQRPGCLGKAFAIITIYS